jgi:hypothetical protein
MIDFEEILRRNPKYTLKTLIIRKSEKNNKFVGLYGLNDGKWIAWLNPEQERELISLGVAKEGSRKKEINRLYPDYPPLDSEQLVRNN